MVACSSFQRSSGNNARRGDETCRIPSKATLRPKPPRTHDKAGFTGGGSLSFPARYDVRTNSLTLKYQHNKITLVTPAELPQKQDASKQNNALRKVFYEQESTAQKGGGFTHSGNRVGSRKLRFKWKTAFKKNPFLGPTAPIESLAGRCARAEQSMYLHKEGHGEARP